MEIWNGKEWISVELDEFDMFDSLVERESDYVDFQADLDEVVDRMMCNPKFYDEIVGWF